MTDEEIVKLVQSGDVDKYGDVVERYENKLKGYIKRTINQAEEEVEDLVQETLIAGYENIQGFDTNKKFSSWIFRIAHNKCIDYFRKNRLKTTNVEDQEEWLLEDTKLIEELEIEAEDKRTVIEAWQKLEPNYREVIGLYYFEDKTYEEISDILHTTTSNVGVLLNRAKGKLKQLLITNY